MTRGVLAAACVVALSAGSGSQVASGQEARTRAADDHGVIAVMRRDGLMIPFAAYRGAKWLAPWPATAQAREMPINLAGIPDDWWGGATPEHWQFRLPGGPARAVSTRVPKAYRSFCNTRIGVTTDYQSAEPVPMPPTDPYPKDGLVFSSDLAVEPIESVDVASAEAASLARTLKPDFDREEDAAITKAHNAHWVHPVKRQGREAIAVRIEAWYRAPMDQPGWTASYIEAVRSYPTRATGPDAGCGLETVFTGWLHQNSADPKQNKVQLTARLTYCDRKGVRYMLPFGRIHLGSQQYWIYQSSGFDGEWYEVVRMAPLKLVFVVESFGGGREGCGFPSGP